MSSSSVTFYGYECDCKGTNVATVEQCISNRSFECIKDPNVDISKVTEFVWGKDMFFTAENGTPLIVVIMGGNPSYFTPSFVFAPGVDGSKPTREIRQKAISMVAALAMMHPYKGVADADQAGVSH